MIKITDSERRMSMNYLVIDLEMCKVPKHYRTPKYKYANEIIQVGAVLLNEDYDRIASINQYVHGNEQLFASKYKLYLPTDEELRAEIETQKTMFYLQQQDRK